MNTVLVVDDEPIVRHVVVRYLEQEGYRTLQARLPAGPIDYARARRTCVCCLGFTREPPRGLRSFTPGGGGNGFGRVTR